MPRTIRFVGLFCVSVLGSVTPLVGSPRVACADTARASVESSPAPAHTAKSPTTQSPPAAAATASPAASPPTAPPPGTSPPATSAPGAAVPPTAPAVVPAATAPSPEAQAAAQAALAAGQAAYASGDYVLAENQFRASLAHVPSAAAEYGLAMTLDLEAKPAQACDAFNALFAMPDFASLPPEQISAAQQRYAVLQTIPAAVSVTVNAAGATLEVDGVIQEGESPFTLRLPAGTHQLRVSATEHEPLEETIEVKPAEDRELTLAPRALPKPAAAPKEVELDAAPPPPPPSKMPAYVTIGVAGAAAITGAIFGIQALNAKSTFDKSPTVAHADDVERSALIADMAFGIAFTLGITGVVLLTTDEPSDPSAERPQTALELTPYVSPTSGGAAARLTF